jgi:hypothetical protein
VSGMKSTGSVLVEPTFREFIVKMQKKVLIFASSHVICIVSKSSNMAKN